MFLVFQRLADVSLINMCAYIKRRVVFIVVCKPCGWKDFLEKIEKLMVKADQCNFKAFVSKIYDRNWEVKSGKKSALGDNRRG